MIHEITKEKPLGGRKKGSEVSLWNQGIYYKRVEYSNLIGYCDCDWGESVDDCRSTSGYSFHIGSGAISWAFKKQNVVVLSTVEAEYNSLALGSVGPKVHHSSFDDD